MAPVSEILDPGSEGRIAAMQSALSPESSESASSPLTRPSELSVQEAQSPLRFRFPGVNQKGPIMGLRPPPPAPIAVHVQSIDENLLRESLADDG